MEVVDHTAAVSPDGRSVTFTLVAGGHHIGGVIDRAALEGYFWLPASADVVRMLKTFEDGSDRIIAMAYRKWLVRPDADVRLGVTDFARR